jgi:hypothetical protein
LVRGLVGGLAGWLVVSLVGSLVSQSVSHLVVNFSITKDVNSRGLMFIPSCKKTIRSLQRCLDGRKQEHRTINLPLPVT